MTSAFHQAAPMTSQITKIIVKVLNDPLEMNFYSQILSTKHLYLIVASILPRRENCMLIRKTLFALITVLLSMISFVVHARLGHRTDSITVLQEKTFQHLIIITLRGPLDIFEFRLEFLGITEDRETIAAA